MQEDTENGDTTAEPPPPWFSELDSLIRRSVKEYLRRFFRGRVTTDGNPVPTEILESDEVVTLVMETDSVHGIDLIYEFLHDHGVPDSAGGFGDDSHLLIKYFSMCARRGIPKVWAAGVILTYLRHCWDVDFGGKKRQAG